MTAQATDQTDERSAREVMTQWRKLNEVKRQLVKQGALNDDATPAQVIDMLRTQIPPDVFG